MTETKSVFSVCGMCTVRCPIQVDVQDGEAVRIQGNEFSPLKGGLCARGAAGIALEQDPEKPQTPLIRVGERGEGKWRAVSWDEALDYVADKLKGVMAEHGPRSVLWSDRGGPFPDLHQAFMRGIGSPNYCNHDASCARNVQHGAQSVIGVGRKMVAYDLRNSKHIILQTRNIMEAINVAEVNAVMDGLGNGAKLTVIDIRGTVSASKADNFFLIRPGTDYAFNLGVIHALIYGELYNKDEVPTMVLVPAYVISELKTGFQIGFLIYIPFLILDMVVASILLSMGMMMLPPVMVSLPFKILLFVMVDGWNLIIGSLVNSFI